MAFFQLWLTIHSLLSPPHVFLTLHSAVNVEPKHNFGRIVTQIEWNQQCNYGYIYIIFTF